MAARGTAAILIVDDEPVVLESTRRALLVAGYNAIITCDDPRNVGTILADGPISLVLLDLNMPFMRGEDVLAQLAEQHPELPVVIITAEYDARVAVRCMKLGAVDYLMKPLDGDQLLGSVGRALEQSALRFEASRLREQFFEDTLDQPECFADIITSDASMLRMFAYLEAVSRSSQPILICGETGTGKELIANAAHRVSRGTKPFVAVNVAGLDDTMFSDALFGHAAGAFTGAAKARRGFVEEAGAGTLFLDEIGDLNESSQVKLLRLLQEREYRPLGSDALRPMHARIVAATHKDPTKLRADLYYRLRAYRVSVPPLRDRLGDLPALVEHFLQRAADDLGKRKPTVPPELYMHLAGHHFPGNVRELRAMVFDAVAQHDQGVMSIAPFLQASGLDDAAPVSADPSLVFPYPMPQLRQIEQAAVEEALRRVQGNQSAAARMLGVSRPTISRQKQRRLKQSSSPPKSEQ